MSIEPVYSAFSMFCKKQTSNNSASILVYVLFWLQPTCCDSMLNKTCLFPVNCTVWITGEMQAVGGGRP